MKVLVTEHISDEGLAILRNHAQVDVRSGLEPQELISIIF